MVKSAKRQGRTDAKKRRKHCVNESSRDESVGEVDHRLPEGLHGTPAESSSRWAAKYLTDLANAGFDFIAVNADNKEKLCLDVASTPQLASDVSVVDVKNEMDGAILPIASIAPKHQHNEPRFLREFTFLETTICVFVRYPDVWHVVLPTGQKKVQSFFRTWSLKGARGAIQAQAFFLKMRNAVPKEVRRELETMGHVWSWGGSSSVSVQRFKLALDEIGRLGEFEIAAASTLNGQARPVAVGRTLRAALVCDSHSVVSANRAFTHDRASSAAKESALTARAERAIRRGLQKPAMPAMEDREAKTVSLVPTSESLTVVDDRGGRALNSSAITQTVTRKSYRKTVRIVPDVKCYACVVAGVDCIGRMTMVRTGFKVCHNILCKHCKDNGFDLRQCAVPTSRLKRLRRKKKEEEALFLSSSENVAGCDPWTCHICGTSVEQDCCFACASNVCSVRVCLQERCRLAARVTVWADWFFCCHCLDIPHACGCKESGDALLLRLLRDAPLNTNPPAGIIQLHRRSVEPFGLNLSSDERGWLYSAAKHRVWHSAEHHLLIRELNKLRCWWKTIGRSSLEVWEVRAMKWVHCLGWSKWEIMKHLLQLEEHAKARTFLESKANAKIPFVKGSVFWRPDRLLLDQMGWPYFQPQG
eukprot:TRINITY_DN37329_c0_g1_i1.p1 TRINITY_DN37329_c0_g1~~TRINITY_DN37329_c0_g1_i1.p1  ORF type:complete len:645 (-),score=64.41 TRINITY_DN37329_c0_g1_i1:125-2059(-)